MKEKQKKTAGLEDLTSAALRILWFFFAYPDKEFSLNDIREETKTSKSNAKKIILDFEKKGLVKREILGRLWRLRANTESARFRHAKIAYNLELVYEIYREYLLEEITKHYPQARAVIFFGSYRKGEDTQKSDIDIAIEVPGTKEPKIDEILSLNKVAYRENVKVNLLVFSRDKVDLNLFANIANGIVLDGVLEAKP